MQSLVSHCEPTRRGECGLNKGATAYSDKTVYCNEHVMK